jgi:hypothetical protein
MQKFVIVAIIILLAAGGFYFFKSSDKSFEDLWAHFQKSGLTVQNPPPPTPAEQKAIDAGNALLKQFGGGNSDIKQEDKIVNNIRIAVRQYSDNKKANDAFDYETNNEQQTKLRYERQGGLYVRTDHYLNGRYILFIRHFEVSASLTPTPSEFNQVDLDKIITSFQSF